MNVYLRPSKYTRQRPRYAEGALNIGYVVSNIGLLASLPNPELENFTLHRYVILALEATLTFMFWAMYSKTQDYNGMAEMC